MLLQQVVKHRNHYHTVTSIKLLFIRRQKEDKWKEIKREKAAFNQCFSGYRQLSLGREEHTPASSSLLNPLNIEMISSTEIDLWSTQTMCCQQENLHSLTQTCQGHRNTSLKRCAPLNTTQTTRFSNTPKSYSSLSKSLKLKWKQEEKHAEDMRILSKERHGFMAALIRPQAHISHLYSE